MRGELLAECLGQRGHRHELGGAAVINPVPQLARAERFGGERRQLSGEGGSAEPDEVGVLRFGQGRGRHGSLYMGRSGA